MLRVFLGLFLGIFLSVNATQSNARFLQPDWFDITQPGVGMNRYSYCFNDPINCRDPGGNQSQSQEIMQMGIYMMYADRRYQSQLAKAKTVNERQKIAHDHRSKMLGVTGYDFKEISEKEIAGRTVTVMDSDNVHFSQDSISKYFSNGTTVEQLAEDLKTGKVKPSEVPPVRVITRNGKVVALDNRRLEAAKRSGVKIRTVPASEQEKQKLGKSRPHANTSIRTRENSSNPDADGSKQKSRVTFGSFLSGLLNGGKKK